ncbi:type II toxin-antitoxin system RelE/ParE family toxin [Leptospira meyeri]|uniref:type II toxin-antitoxin system RelE/ParE family toxin n=1 Tax=Leptospira meyeri TaxID=29508 RepID=UPI001FAF7D6C|nr:type II toxin-antitoxin system RelE/ParE family toxin [Leptospira meyeri]
MPVREIIKNKATKKPLDRYNLHVILRLVYEIKRTEEIILWIKELDNDAKKDILVSIEILKEFGPRLGRPHVDTITGSKIKNLKELRVNSKNRPFRIFFVFDPKRNAILLIGGNKATSKKFYPVMIKKSEELYSEYLGDL